MGARLYSTGGPAILEGDPAIFDRALSNIWRRGGGPAVGPSNAPSIFPHLPPTRGAALPLDHPTPPSMFPHLRPIWGAALPLDTSLDSAGIYQGRICEENIYIP
jgi:hypothetical protein